MIASFATYVQWFILYVQLAILCHLMSAFSVVQRNYDYRAGLLMCFTDNYKNCCWLQKLRKKGMG